MTTSNSTHHAPRVQPRNLAEQIHHLNKIVDVLSEGLTDSEARSLRQDLDQIIHSSRDASLHEALRQRHEASPATAAKGFRLREVLKAAVIGLIACLARNARGVVRGVMSAWLWAVSALGQAASLTLEGCKAVAQRCFRLGMPLISLGAGV